MGKRTGKEKLGRKGRELGKRMDKEVRQPGSSYRT